MVADNKARLLQRLTELAKAAGARDAATLAKSLALLIEGAYAASQTFRPESSVMTALASSAKLLIDAAIGHRTRLRPGSSTKIIRGGVLRDSK
jgi:hypothetical protein